MKKSSKITLTVLSVALVAVLAVSLCACLADGTSGADGLSAYEIAVKNGFEGTETEWLESLKSSGTVVNQVTYNISGVDSDIVSAANTGLQSIVSVYCSFTKTSSYGGWFSPSSSREETYTSAGAGVIFSLEDDGSAFIVTNYHVVYSSDSNNSDKISSDISVFLYGSENTSGAIAATYVGGSLNYDIAVLRVDDSSVLKEAIERGTVAAVSLGDSDSVSAGQTCIAIGNPEANGISVTQGIISVDSEYISLTAADEQTTISIRVMRTDTGVNSGNSGGGLFDAEGKLLGIVNAKMNTSTAENIAYAIPSSLVASLAQNIIDNCYNQTNSSVLRPMLGVEVEVTEAYTVVNEQTGLLTKCETVKIATVTSDGIANGKLQVGDIVQSITVGGQTKQVTRSYMLSETLLNARVGDTVTIVVLRDGVETTVEIEITSAAISSY